MDAVGVVTTSPEYVSGKRQGGGLFDKMLGSESSTAKVKGCWPGVGP